MDSILSIDVLSTKSLTDKEWLIYYRNVWMRNVVARTIDVDCDAVLKANNPDEMVQNDNPNDFNKQFLPVAERLERRKIALADGIKLIASIDRLLAIENIPGTFWTEDALKVSDDMMRATDPNAAPVDTVVEEVAAAAVATTEVTPEAGGETSGTEAPTPEATPAEVTPSPEAPSKEATTGTN